MIPKQDFYDPKDKDLCEVREFDGKGAEKFAEHAFNFADKLIREATDNLLLCKLNVRTWCPSAFMRRNNWLKLINVQYTQEQWKVILNSVGKVKNLPTCNELNSSLEYPSNYVVCLKHGKKYGPEYVNALHNMVKRNPPLDYEFVCFTEDTQGIDRAITTQLVALSEAWLVV